MKTKKNEEKEKFMQLYFLRTKNKKLADACLPRFAQLLVLKIIFPFFLLLKILHYLCDGKNKFYFIIL
jgi:hypothetical protein